MVRNTSSFYNKQMTLHKRKVSTLFKSLSVFSSLRLIVFVFTAIGIYFTFPNWKIVVAILLIGSVIFLVLLSKYTDLKLQRALHKRLVKINEQELKIASGDFYDLPNGSEYQDASHYYSLDMDLFGKGSFFQYTNRTTIKEGTDTLAKELLANNINGITKRQNAIRELSHLAGWRQHYTAIAQGVQVEQSATSIMSWLKDYRPFVSRILYGFTIGFGIVSLTLILLSFTETIPWSAAGYWLLFGLLITGIYLKRVNHLAENTSKAKDTFRQYALLLKEIELQSFTAELLVEKQRQIQSEGVTASRIFSKFSKALDALDNRNNFISAIFGNGYLLWDIHQTYHVEQWILRYAHKVEDWFNTVTFFDAYNSFGNYAFNHQEFTYPEITNQKTAIKAKDLGHPLLNAEKCVNSDVELQQEQFFIVTGANMAGKSTFLRTVGLHIVMANIGLPVCAKESAYSPVKLISSMRTTDSLTDDSSYFFSELKRLKFIVDTIENDTGYLVVLDEILKGTNSKDKAIGSRKFVEQLSNLKSTGIIATHDLSLTEIEAELETVKNYYFDAQIINDELHFDYKLKEGVCKNMNASFLLKKMEII